MRKNKYVTTEISGIVRQIAMETGLKGYTVGILESLLPDDSDLNNWSDAQVDLWIKDNNDRMGAIRKFLNENDL